MFRTRAILTLLALALVPGLLVAQPDRAGALPSAVLHHKPSLPATLDQYAGPGNIIIVTAQQRHRNPERLRAWRAKGTIVMAYVNLVDYREPWDPIEENLFGGAFPREWLYPGNRVNWPNTLLLNLERGSPVATYNGFRGTWGQYGARWIRDNVIGDGSLFNGVLLDVWGDKIWSLGIGGPGSAWEAGVAEWGRELRQLVGPNIYLVGNNTQTRSTAAALNGRMWESFTTQPNGNWNQLDGPNDGLRQTFAWSNWHKPQLDILWRNEGAPSAATKQMLVDAANRVTRTGSDIAVGASDHVGGFPAPFGGGVGVAPVQPVVPPSRPGGGSGSTPSPAPGGASVSVVFARGHADWRPDRVGGASLRTTPAGLRVVVGSNPTARGLLWRALPGRRDVRVDLRVRVQASGLRPGRARAVVAVAAANGARREAGPMRTATGALRWATWVRQPNGRRVAVRVSPSAVRPGWVRLRLATGWRTPARRDHLTIGAGRPVAAPAAALSGRTPTRVAVGLGPAGSRAPAAVTIRSLQAVGR